LQFREERIVKVEAAPDLILALRSYAEPFHADPPAILQLFSGDAPLHPQPIDPLTFSAGPGDFDGTGVIKDSAPAPQPPKQSVTQYGFEPLFPFAPDSDRGLGILLLAASLYKPSGSLPFGAGPARLIAALYREFGTDIFRLNRLPFETLRDVVDAQGRESSDLMDADERARIPGILRSVCDFFYRIGPLSKWLAGAEDWETRVGELSQEIYWMGAQSRTRTKARLLFWLACQVPGFGIRHGQAVDFAWPVSDGHMRFLFDILKPPRGGKAGAVPPPEMRGLLFADFARTVFPEAPWMLYGPLDAFLKPVGGGELACRTVQGGCRFCALSARCPAAKHDLARPR